MKTTKREPIIGVDFSGAADAGRRIWIAWGTPVGGRLQIDSCEPAQDLPGSGRTRDESLNALRELIISEGRAAIGLDFPFGLPRALVEYDDWEWFALGFPRDYVTPEAFRAACLEAADGRELKRVTDTQAQTPFSPYNIRLYRQTYYGIRDLLRPLFMTDQARMLPMQVPSDEKSWLLEICPASTLKLAGHYVPYKGRGDACRAARERILTELERGTIAIPHETIRSTILDDPGGDALDSVIAAVTTSQALDSSPSVDPDYGNVYAIEGYVYLGNPKKLRPRWGSK